MPRRRQRIIAIHLDERSVLRRSPEIEHERRVAIFDLLEENFFAPAGDPAGPYVLHLSIHDGRLVFDIRSEDDRPLACETLSLAGFQRLVKDYFIVCASYYQAVRQAIPGRLEAIDMGRRGLHDEGGAMLRERLAGRVDVDVDTARRLFTLVCILHLRVMA